MDDMLVVKTKRPIEDSNEVADSAIYPSKRRKSTNYNDSGEVDVKSGPIMAETEDSNSDINEKGDSEESDKNDANGLSEEENDQDDFSEDETANIVASLALQHSNLRLLRLQDLEAHHL